jgi:hypothetical protein
LTSKLQRRLRSPTQNSSAAATLFRSMRPLEDVQLRNAVIGVLIGLLTISNSNREAWMEKLEAAGYAWLAKIGDGEVTVIGASTDSTDEIAAGAGTFHGTEIDDPVFDIGDPRASVLDVFPSLTLPRTRSR